MLNFNSKVNKKKEFFFKNLTTLIDSAGGYAAAARQAEITERAVRDWILKQNNPRFIDIARIAKSAKISLDWLAGYENTEKEFGQSDEQSGASKKTKHYPPKDNTSIKIWGEDKKDLDHIFFRKQYLNKYFGVNADDCLLVGIEDSSAEPLLMRGSFCVVHANNTPHNGIWFFNQNGVATVRQCITRFDGGTITYPLVTSPQPPAAESLTKKQFQKLAIGRALWGGGRLLI